MERMPALFIGHGSPMNAIEDNDFARTWEQLADKIPKPKAILSVSAHWYTPGTRITDNKAPRTIYDMYGFPEELYQIVYNAPGDPELAHKAKAMISKNVEIDNTWGFDHGTWAVLCRIYPKANIPVVQLSVNRNARMEGHFKIGQEISKLRDEGVLILGSGNIVHNLGMVNWGMDSGYDWADEFDEYIKTSIMNRNFANVINYQKLGIAGKRAVPIADHYAPLLYVLGAARAEDAVAVLNEARTLGSISMTCYLFN